MATSDELERNVHMDLTAGLDAVLAELEQTALTKAKTLVESEAKTLRARVAKLETLVEQLQARARSATPPAAPKPAATAATAPVPQPVQPARPRGTVRKAARPRSPTELPPLPAERTLATIAAYLRTLGFELRSHRASGGGAWVFETQEKFGHVAEHLKKNGIGVSRYAHGRRLYAGDHYEIDPYKVLPAK
jgi:hypothetical protein